jgi:hypothetical protein
MEQEIDRLIEVWKGPFANHYIDKPRLSTMIRDAELDFIESGIEEDGGMLYIIMYVFNNIQKEWIENNVLLDMQETYARLAGIELLSIGIDIMKNENLK